MTALSPDLRSHILVVAQLLVRQPQRGIEYVKHQSDLPIRLCVALEKAFTAGGVTHAIERLRYDNSAEVREVGGILRWVHEAKSSTTRRTNARTTDSA